MKERVTYLNGSFLAPASELAKASLKGKSEGDLQTYPFDLLDHGDSFYVPFEKEIHHSLKVNISRRNSNRNGRKFAIIHHESFGYTEVVRIS